MCGTQIVSVAHEYITKVKKIIPDAAMDELVCGNTITFSGVGLGLKNILQIQLLRCFSMSFSI